MGVLGESTKNMLVKLADNTRVSTSVPWLTFSPWVSPTGPLVQACISGGRAGEGLMANMGPQAANTDTPGSQLHCEVLSKSQGAPLTRGFHR